MKQKQRKQQETSMKLKSGRAQITPSSPASDTMGLELSVNWGKLSPATSAPPAHQPLPSVLTQLTVFTQEI